MPGGLFLERSPNPRLPIMERGGAVAREWFRFFESLFARGVEWIAVRFDATDFTANGAMTWTVAEADQVTLAYTLLGRTLLVAFNLVDTTVGGTPNTQLRIALPGGLQADGARAGLCAIVDNGTAGVGKWAIADGGTALVVTRADGANWAASANATRVEGHAMLTVQG